MSYNKGNFYHENGKQVFDGIALKNVGFDDAIALPSGSTIDGVGFMRLNVVPTTETAAPGTICISVTEGGEVGLYIQEGTATEPSWGKTSEGGGPAPLPVEYFNISNGEISGFSSAGQTAYDNGEITALILPSEDGGGNPITSIGNGAFRSCTNLTSITIPNSVTSIGQNAFYGCTGLTSVTIPSSVTSIGSQAFYGCTGLTSITIPNSVTSIGSSAFYGCTGLTSITIPNSVTSIGSMAFSGCTGLTSISVDSGNSVYHSAGNCIIHTADKVLIAGCKDSAIPADGSVTSIGQGVFYNCTSLTSINIPDSITEIGVVAFYGCSGLTSITIPSSVTSIGNSAFSGCSGLTSVTIGSGVISIGESAFDNCSGLTSIIVDSNNITYDSRNNCNCVIETATNTLILGCKNSIIPNTVVVIGDRAFSNCPGLTSITIPNSVTSIGSMAFSGCAGLTSVTIPDSITEIGMAAFENCSSLISVTIGSGVTSIGDMAFVMCLGLTSITVKPIVPPELGFGAFEETNDAPIYVPAQSVAAYQGATNWVEYAGRIQAIY